MKTLFIRDENKMIDLSEDKDSPNRVKSYDSVNKAKKASTKIQISNGGLGRGSVMLA